MSKEKKPREFWIALKHDGSLSAFELPCDDYTNYCGAVAVIEHAAYLKLEAKLEIAVEALAEIRKYALWRGGDAWVTIEAFSDQAVAKINEVK